MYLGISFFVSYAWGLLSFLDLLLYIPVLVLCIFLVLDCYLYLGCLFLRQPQCKKSVLTVKPNLLQGLLGLSLF